MKRQLTVAGAALLVVTGGVWWAFAAGNGSATANVPYAGYLEHNGQPVDGVVDLTLALCSASSAGSCPWSELQSGVPVIAGRFAVQLGSIAALDAATLTNNPWLEVTVSKDASGAAVNLLLEGRQMLGATPYAYRGAPGKDFAIDGSVTVGGSVVWGGSRLNGDQTGSIELGSSAAAGTAPFIDFHHGVSGSEDYNVRLINDAPQQLSAVGNLNVTGNAGVGGNLAVGGTVKGKALELTCQTVMNACTTATSFRLNCPAGYLAVGSGWLPCVNWETASHTVTVANDAASCDFYANVQNDWQGTCTCCKVR